MSLWLGVFQASLFLDNRDSDEFPVRKGKGYGLVSNSMADSSTGKTGVFRSRLLDTNYRLQLLT